MPWTSGWKARSSKRLSQARSRSGLVPDGLRTRKGSDHCHCLFTLFTQKKSVVLVNLPPYGEQTLIGLCLFKKTHFHATDVSFSTHYNKRRSYQLPRPKSRLPTSYLQRKIRTYRCMRGYAGTK